jgi:hypothetical protein
LHRREQVLVLVQAGGAQRLVLGLFADDVDHVVDGDAAEQDVVVVHHRRGDPVVVGELARHFVRGLDVDRRLLVVEQAVDRRAGLVREQRLQRDPAEVLVAAADHVQVVGVLGQFAAQAQVAQHHVDVVSARTVTTSGFIRRPALSSS